MFADVAVAAAAAVVVAAVIVVVAAAAVVVAAVDAAVELKDCTAVFGASVYKRCRSCYKWSLVTQVGYNTGKLNSGVET